MPLIGWLIIAVLLVKWITMGWLLWILHKSFEGGR